MKNFDVLTLTDSVGPRSFRQSDELPLDRHQERELPNPGAIRMVEQGVPVDQRPASARTKKRNSRQRRSYFTRPGLAPVEMAMALPMLMLFMATIIAFGYAASWKMRSEVVARNVGWRSRHPRWANFNERVVEWPQPATMGRHNDAPLSSLRENQVIQAPIIVGPLPQINVNSRTLDFTRDVVVGDAQIIRTPPVLPRLGTFHYDTDHSFLDDHFSHAEMGISNYSRRIPLIYQTDLDFILDSVPIRVAVAAIENNPFRLLLMALEDDTEFLNWYGWAPDFHPRISIRNYRLDRDWVRRNKVESLLDRIDRLPQRMVSATISLYRTQLNHQPPPSDMVQRQLEKKIEELQNYLEILQERYRQKRMARGGQNLQRTEPS